MQTIETDAVRWQSDGEGTWLCLRTERARRICETLEPGKRYDAELRPHRRRRSLDANAYCWVLLDKLSAALGRPKTELYRAYVLDVGGNSETVCVVSEAAERLRRGWEHNGLGWLTDALPSKVPGCVNVVLYYGSSTYDTAQMSRLIDLIVQDCEAQGIETLTPRELDALKERWA